MNYFNSIATYGHCASFSPLREHTGARHSLTTYEFFFFFKFLTAIVKGVIALNVVFLKRSKQEFLYELFYLDLLERSTSLSVWRWEKVNW